MTKLLCAAILFDLDGVLVDSRGSVERQWRRWALEFGLDPEEVIHIAHGRPTIETIREFAPPHLDTAAELVKMETREIGDMDLVKAIPGAAGLLARIPPDRWTVVTSGTRPLAEARLRYVGLPVPATMVTASDISRGKPDPEPYLKGAMALGFAPGECVVIEDAPSGVQAGKSAGMRVIAVPTTYAASEIAAADYVLQLLSELRVTIVNDAERRNAALEITVPDS